TFTFLNQTRLLTFTGAHRSSLNFLYFLVFEFKPIFDFSQGLCSKSFGLLGLLYAFLDQGLSLLKKVLHRFTGKLDKHKNQDAEINQTPNPFHSGAAVFAATFRSKDRRDRRQNPEPGSRNKSEMTKYIIFRFSFCCLPHAFTSFLTISSENFSISALKATLAFSDSDHNSFLACSIISRARASAFDKVSFCRDCPCSFKVSNAVLAVFLAADSSAFILATASSFLPVMDLASSSAPVVAPSLSLIIFARGRKRIRLRTKIRTRKLIRRTKNHRLNS